jgi:hypothetical protein
MKHWDNFTFFALLDLKKMNIFPAQIRVFVLERFYFIINVSETWHFPKQFSCMHAKVRTEAGM